MTVSVATSPASLSLSDTRVIVCSSTECNLEVTGLALAHNLRWGGLCNDCHEEGVTPPAKPAAPRPTMVITRKITPTNTAADDIRRCRFCDGNIATLPADRAFCGSECEELHDIEASEAAEAIAKAAPAKKTRSEAMARAIEVVRFAYPTITEYEAETGLTAAVAHWSNGRVAGRGIVAAARAWVDSTSGEDYAEMSWNEQGRANRKALPILKAAIRAAQQYRATMAG